MKRLKMKYYPIKGGDGERMGAKTRSMVKCYVSYNFGGHNWATLQTEARGYYAYVCPVTLEYHDDGLGVVESFDLFSGRKWLLLECGRQGSKKEAEARRLFDEKHKELVLQLYANSPDKDNIDFEHPEE